MTTLVNVPAAGPPRPGKRRANWIKRGLLATVAAPLSVTLAASAFFQIHLDGGLRLTPRFTIGEWVHDIPSHLPWVLAFAALTAAILPLRALQWRFTLGERAPGFGPRYHAIAIGAFFHNAVPGKLGEFVRALVLARKHKLPFFESLGSVLICKLLELLALLTVVGVALAGPLGHGFAPKLGTALSIALFVASGFIALALLGARYATALADRLERQHRLPRLRTALLHLGAGLRASRSPKRTALALLAAFGPVCASALAYGVALQSLGVPRGIFAGGVVLGAVSLGQLTPGLPIGTGMYYLMTSWAARTLGATPAQAAAFAALTHLTTFVTQLLVGLVSLLVHRIRPRELLRERAAAMASPVAAGVALADEPLHPVAALKAG